MGCAFFVHFFGVTDIFDYLCIALCAHTQMYMRERQLLMHIQ